MNGVLGVLYRNVAKPLLFRMDPEKVHHLTIGGLSLIGKLPGAVAMLERMYGVEETPELSTELWGIRFPHPVGLAAGLDKNAKAVDAFSSMGFGFIEVGTVTPLPQQGNELPRLFRLPDDEALINRMGFNNCGMKQLAHNLRQTARRTVPVAINIGKNKTTPNEQAESDYRKCIEHLYSSGDFFVVNISSPNTPDLRKLQNGDHLRSLLQAVTEEMEKQRQIHGSGVKPVLVKIAPDVTDPELEEMVETIASSGVSGVIATNTTLSRDGLTDVAAKETGGLSGKPLTRRSTEIIRMIYRATEGKLPIIGCGGIFSDVDAYEKIRAGASLVEIYTALIYEGPEINRAINSGIRELLRKDGYTHISQAVGSDS